jgi:DNA polymerase III alpha subunit
MSYFQYIVHTEYSIQQSFCHIDDLVKKAYELKLTGLAITDFHTLSGCVEFIQQVEKINKTGQHKIKPVLGCTFNFKDDNNINKIILLARNKNGWFNLIKILGLSKFNKGTEYIDIDSLNNLVTQDIICIHLESYSNSVYHKLNTLFQYNFFHNSINDNGIFCNPVYYVNSDDKIYQQIICCSNLNLTLKDKDKIIINYPQYKIFFDETDLSLQSSGDIRSQKILDIIESYSLSNKPRIPTFKSNDTFVDPDNKLVELCRNGWTNRKINDKTKNNPSLRQVYIDRMKKELQVFNLTQMSNYMLIIHDIIQKAKKINIQIGLRGSAAGCLVSYIIGISNIDPIIPDPTLPYHPDRCLLFERFMNVGRFSLGEISFDEYPYSKFIKENNDFSEKSIITKEYAENNPWGQFFLEEYNIVNQQERGWEYYTYIKKYINLDIKNLQNSYIMYAWNKVNNYDGSRSINRTKENFSIPDIDCDVGISYRQSIIDQIKNQYGELNVSNIITFGRMDGKGAIKEVFRVLNPVSNSFEVANIITDIMIDTSKIQDILEDYKEDDPKYNSINYCIDNIPDIAEYYKEYKREFDIAIKLASTINFRGKHAAGIVISDSPINETFPTLYDEKTDRRIVALEMVDLEYVGGVKFDILGVAAYEKIDKIVEMVNNNFNTPNVGNIILEDKDEVL